MCAALRWAGRVKVSGAVRPLPCSIILRPQAIRDRRPRAEYSHFRCQTAAAASTRAIVFCPQQRKLPSPRALYTLDFPTTKSVCARPCLISCPRACQCVPRKSLTHPLHPCASSLRIGIRSFTCGLDPSASEICICCCWGSWLVLTVTHHNPHVAILRKSDDQSPSAIDNCLLSDRRSCSAATFLVFLSTQTSTTPPPSAPWSRRVPIQRAQLMGTMLSTLAKVVGRYSRKAKLSS